MATLIIILNKEDNNQNGKQIIVQSLLYRFIDTGNDAFHRLILNCLKLVGIGTTLLIVLVIVIPYHLLTESKTRKY